MRGCTLPHGGLHSHTHQHNLAHSLPLLDPLASPEGPFAAAMLALRQGMGAIFVKVDLGNLNFEQ